MPEQITKYPEVTLRVLQGAGARCGPDVERNILTECPPERFCSFPTGEVCIYGLDDIPKMTQVTPQELAAVVCPDSSAAVPPAGDSLNALLLGAVFIAGLVLGAFSRRRRPG